MESISKFSQGTIWQWSPEGEIQYNKGVQAGPRPVLIISNNTFNTHSSSVNCVTITSVLKDSPVHVPIHLSVVSHIQCEQVHTVPKKELNEFKGIVSHVTLMEVLDKLKFQFNMTDKRKPDLLQDVEDKIMNLSGNVKQDNNEAKQESNLASILKDILSSLDDVKKEFAGLQHSREAYEDEPGEDLLDLEAAGQTADTVSEEESFEEPRKVRKQRKSTAKTSGKAKKPRKTSVKKKEKEKRRRYSEVDKAYIVDENNTVDDLVEKYGFRDRETAYKVRYYFKRVFKPQAQE